MHKQLLKQEYHEYMEQRISNQSSGFWKKAGQALGRLFGEPVIDQLVERLIDIEDYSLFSVGVVKWGNKSHIVSVGVFGKVILTDEWREALENGALNK